SNGAFLRDMLIVLVIVVAAVVGWRLWRGRRWAKWGWLQGLLLLVTVLIGLWWYSRARLDYNEEGRAFDAEQMIVYHQQDEEMLRIAFMISFTVWIISMVGRVKH